MPARLLITSADRMPGDDPGVWRRGQISSVYLPSDPLGDGQEVAGGAFYHFVVIDKTPEEMLTFLDPYNRAIDMAVIAGPDPQGFRRINVRNNNCNATGTIGAWTTEAADAIIAEWNALYPTCGLATVAVITGTHPNDTWQCEGTFTVGQALEFEETIINKGLSTLDSRRIWYITEAGMQNIEANGGTQQGTSAQLNGILRDRRAD